MRHSWFAVPAVLALSLTGCGTGANFTAATTSSGSGTTAASTGQITGRVHGGNQPITGASILLFTVGSAGYGSDGTNILFAGTYTTSDGSGQINSNANAGNQNNSLPAGYFTITGDYNCPVDNPYVLLVSYGGNPGLSAGTDNTAIEFIAPLSDCNTLKANAAATTVNINEVTTAGAAYAFSQFLYAGIGSYSYSQQGLINAFATYHNIVDNSTGTARSTTASGTGTVPQSEINSIANALAPCTNSASIGSTECTAMQTAMEAASTVLPYTESNTLAAALALALVPGNITAQTTRNQDVFNLSLPNAPFQPALTSAPSDWTMAVSYPFSDANAKPLNIAIDSVGNVWSVDAGDDTVSLFSNLGVPAVNSPFGGSSCSGCFSTPRGIAIDSTNTVWIANTNSNSAMELNSNYNGSNNIIDTVSGPWSGVGLSSSTAVAIDRYNNAWFSNQGGGIVELYANNSGSQTITDPSLDNAVGIAFDTSGNAWVANNDTNSLVEIEANGQLSPNSPFTGGGLSMPYAIAIDGSHHLWITSNTATRLAEFTDGGAPVSSSSGITGGGIGSSPNIAVDGAGNIWTLSYASNNLLELSSLGAPISPSTGYTAASLNSPRGLALDSSGNVWISNVGGATNYLTEFIGLAAPTISPLATALQQGQLGQKPGTPIPVGIESISLPPYYPDGAHSYSAQLYAFGGNTGGYTWSATSLPSGLAISTSGLISGSSTVSGSTTVHVTVCDSGNSSNCATKDFTLNSSDDVPTQGNEAALHGQYAVRFSSISSFSVTQTNYPGSVFGVAFIGSLTFDAAGGLSGTLDINTPGGQIAADTVTGKYSLGADGRGSMNVVSGLGLIQFTFSVGNFSSGIAQTLHFVEFDNTNATAASSPQDAGAGIGKLQTPAAFAASTLQKTFVFGLSGETSCNNDNHTNPTCAESFTSFGPVNAVGLFTSASANTISSGQEDVNVIGGTNSGITLSGGYTNPNSSGRGTLSLNPAGAVYPRPPTDFVYYVVNSGEIFLLSSDAHDGFTLLSGDALVNTPEPFSNTTLDGSYILSFQAGSNGDGVAFFPTQTHAGIFRATVDSGHANLDVIGDENDAGTTKLDQDLGATPYSVDANGRVTISNIGLILYLADPTTGFAITVPSTPGDLAALVNFQQQAAATYSNATINGTFAFGTAPAVVFNSNQTGILTSTGDGSANVTLDSAQNTGILAAAQSTVFSFTTDATGRVPATESNGGSSILYLLDSNTGIALSTNPGDTAPSLTWIQR